MIRQRRKFYLVTRRKKDIFDIAEEVYGSKLMAARIMQINPGIFHLCAGMVLKLPQDIPQLPLTTDQAIRLDFAGLLGSSLDRGGETSLPAEVDANNNEPPPADK